MKNEKKDINKLTRGLMEGTAQTPSPGLLGKIMERVMQEKKAIQKNYFRKLPSPGVLFGILLIYMLVVAGISYLFLSQPEATGAIKQKLKDYFPIFFTVATGISFFFFFTQLDNWLHAREKKNTK